MNWSEENYSEKRLTKVMRVTEKEKEVIEFFRKHFKGPAGWEWGVIYSLYADIKKTHDEFEKHGWLNDIHGQRIIAEHNALKEVVEKHRK